MYFVSCFFDMCYNSFVKKFWKNLNSLFLDLLYPEYRCIFCGNEAKDNYLNVCDRCKNKVTFLKEEGVCLKCGMPLASDFDKVCASCKKYEYAFDLARAVAAYDGDVVSAVHSFKYSGQKFKAKYMARMMASKFLELNLKVDYITFVPMFEDKKKERGFNQAELLAENFAKIVDLPLISVLDKICETESQTTFDAKVRMKNLQGSIALNKEIAKKIKGANVLIIDDVFTTGATLNECSKLLKKAKVKNVYCITIAKVILDE